MGRRDAMGDGRARVVGIAGASGGLGASCLAAALATRAVADSTAGGRRRGRRAHPRALGHATGPVPSRPPGVAVACADATPAGGGIDVLFDLDGRPGARWPDLAQSRGRLDGAALLRHLPATATGVSVLAARWPDHLDPDAADPPDGRYGPADPGDVLTALAEAVDVLVLDLGRAEPGSLCLDALARCDDVVLVGGSSVPALARLAGAVALLEASAPGRIWLVQRAPRGRAELGDLVAANVGVPLAAVLLDDPHLDDDLAHGVTPGERRGRLADVAEQVWRTVGPQERAA